MRSTSFSPTAAVDGAAGEQMLGAVDFRRLGEHRGAAVLDQLVDRGAERRVGGDAGIAVRAAALQRQRDLGGGPRLALGLRRDRQHGLDAFDAFLDRLARAAGRLDGHGLEVIAFDKAVFVLQAIDLEHLAAEARPSARRRGWDAWRSPIASAAASRSLRRRPPCRSRCHARKGRRRRLPGSRPGGRSC